jgi:hypothetical protein
MLREVFWVAFVKTISDMLLKLAFLAYKSKCKEYSLCSIKMVRGVEEKDFEMLKGLKHTYTILIY